ncbi:alpha/beta fold hydrolase [Brevundimonas albigilva]|uniref:Alpha/beta fold hydrolase n=1 Tax=Brevundimonas albigilva TaxID=1312364 RepID=A0ABY4SPH1_9CAUL|nr:alpha/beta hydrolase [Brevundimonas albigilva]UQV18578.1 alpha/beta fold hydrolase [Brevundimonas albigilva]URI16652.1 alpha/beta fold hydrolase [Brevundimonas albigilva]
MIVRAVLASLALLSAPVTPALAFSPSGAEAAAVASTRQTLTTPDGRVVPLSTWTAPDERGVVVFSHGFGGAPEAYQRLLSAWAAHGFTVIAPLHVDSQQHPDRSANGQVALTTRLEDLALTRAVAEREHLGKPLVVAGHSFGSLMSLIAGGATTILGPQGDPAVKGVIALSSPGPIPVVVTPETYRTLAAPLLVVTGDQDIVPGYADDWRDHRLPFDTAPEGDKTLIVIAGGGHQTPATAEGEQFDLLVRATEDFLDAYALGDAEAKGRLDALSAPGVTVEHR